MTHEVVVPRAQPIIDVAPFHEWPAPDGNSWLLFYRSGDDYLLRFPGLADFEVTADGRTVRCWPVPDVTPATLEHLYHNQVLPLALSRQGRLVLHASAVDLGQVAVAFVGRSGRGKSTLAASLARQGFGLLTDDGLELDEDGDGFRVRPGRSSVRLWQDSHEALLDQPARLAPAVQYTTKIRILAEGSLALCERPRPLRGVYLLGDGAAPEPSIERIGPRDALIELVGHSFLLDVEARELIAAHFDQLSRLVLAAGCFRLDYPRRFSALPEVGRAILEHRLEPESAAGQSRVPTGTSG